MTMKLRINLTPGQVKEARKLRSWGMAWTAIARQIGATDEEVRRRIDPEFIEREKKRAHCGKIHLDRREQGSYFRPSKAEFLAAQKLIPPDDRDLTSRLMGDPLVGRRALDMRGAK